MDIVVDVVGNCMSCLCQTSSVNQPVEKWCTYMICPRKELKELGRKKEDLIAIETDVNRRVHIAELEHGKTRTSETQTWFTRVKSVLEKTEKIEAKAKVAKPYQPYCCSRPKLGERVLKLVTEMNELIDKGRQFTNESVALHSVENGMRLPTTELVGNTARRSLNDVWECILNVAIMIIGIYGKSGVGKTLIAKTINNRLLEADLSTRFDKIIWVTVSQNADIYKLQRDIGAAVNLNLSSEEDEMKRAGLLLKALKQRKRFVLILDNMSRAFLLHDIGIPQPSRDNGCKLVLTTTSQEVCKMMGCQRNSTIGVEALTKDEAWELFTVEFGMALAPDAETVAREVVAECACFPPAIIKVCGVMRGVDDVREWRVALSDLRNTVENQQ